MSRLFRKIASQFAIMVLLSAAALAGDTSHRHLATFANDGMVFVLIENGVTDGLGAPYVNAYAIDVASDRWMSGFPISNAMDEEQVHAFERRVPDDFELRERLMSEQVLAQALDKPELAQLLENKVATDHRVSNTPWELSANTKIARFTALDLLPYDNKAWKVELTTIAFPASDKCYGQSEKMFGYKLVLTNESDGSSRILHEDSRIPASRGCPLGYAIADVFTHSAGKGDTKFAIVLRMSQPGFEGPNRRLMALTGRF